MTARPKPFRLTAPPPTREHPFHASVAKVLTIEIARPGHVSREGVIWWTVDHGVAEGQLPGTALERGCIAGIPDILLIDRGLARVLELKAEDGQVSPAQKSVLTATLAARGQVGVCSRVEHVLACLDRWEVPRARRVRLAA